MHKTAITLFAICLAAAASLASPTARAEGGQSVGHGIKCYWVPVVQANGTTVYERICRKGP